MEPQGGGGYLFSGCRIRVLNLADQAIDERDPIGFFYYALLRFNSTQIGMRSKLFVWNGLREI